MNWRLGHGVCQIPRRHRESTQSEKKRAEAEFAKSSQRLDELRAQAHTGDIVLACLDEAGFAQVHPNRNAWTLRGERLNVIAALLSTGQVVHALTR